MAALATAATAIKLSTGTKICGRLFNFARAVATTVSVCSKFK